MFFLGLRRMCLLLSPGGVFCTCHLDPVVMSLLISCLLGLPVTWLLSLQLQPWIVYISLQFYKFLPHVFWCLLGVKPCYVFLKNWPLYHYMSLSSKVCFVYLLLIGVSMAYLSPTWYCVLYLLARYEQIGVFMSPNVLSCSFNSRWPTENQLFEHPGTMRTMDHRRRQDISLCWTDAGQRVTSILTCELYSYLGLGLIA